MKTLNSIKATLIAAGVSFRLTLDRDGSIFVDTDTDTAARDALGFDRFTGHINGHEVTIG